MANLDKMNEMLMKNPDLAQEVSSEILRMEEAGETHNAKAAFAQAVRTVLDIDFTEEELNKLFPGIRGLAA